MIRALFVFVLTCTFFSQALAHPCDGYKDDLGHRDLKAAYDFGLEIQKAIRNKDKRAFLSLMDGEVKNYGPRRAVIESQLFDTTFPPDWQDVVLAEKPSCEPVGYKGYMLGSGWVWYAESETASKGFSIISLNALDQDTFFSQEKRPDAWRIDGKIIPPQCFSYPWISNDNFEVYVDRYHLNMDKLTKNPGIYFGKEIPDFVSLSTGWETPAKVSLTNNLKNCLPEGRNVRVEEGEVISGKIPEADAYRVLGIINDATCKSLLPNYPVKPTTCYALEVIEYVDGSMGQYARNYIYGLIEDKDDRYIVPLKGFEKRNDLLNYVEKNPIKLPQLDSSKF